MAPLRTARLPTLDSVAGSAARMAGMADSAASDLMVHMEGMVVVGTEERWATAVDME